MTEPSDQPVDNKSNRLFYEILILTALCGLISGSIYYYRTEYMELSPVWDSAFRAVRMTVLYLVVPLLWLVKIRNFSFTDLGITTKNFLVATVLGIGVYAIALTIFLMSIGNPEFDRYFLWGNDMTAGEFAAIMALVAWMAALTDIWTRGMVMMPILKLKGIPLAILAQNVVWFAAHAYEIEFLIGSLSYTCRCCYADTCTWNPRRPGGNQNAKYYRVEHWTYHPQFSFLWICKSFLLTGNNNHKQHQSCFVSGCLTSHESTIARKHLTYTTLG
jgi:hypothetical protein